ncbi:hypothetical protein PROFUN_05422 [Planoprotostelium fungivorum]|uniref:Uncharacterized protein n=1 Tax=Planoprotostelium fungivorum TaxID=1890364 RepID=A0A2P6NQQ1_9EUKA|nr:hypothetical protein PROFUN_05422 [Planoprotostelium fungivorum]
MKLAEGNLAVLSDKPTPYTAMAQSKTVMPVDTFVAEPPLASKDDILEQLHPTITEEERLESLKGLEAFIDPQTLEIRKGKFEHDDTMTESINKVEHKDHKAVLHQKILDARHHEPQHAHQRDHVAAFPAHQKHR